MKINSKYLLAPLAAVLFIIILIVHDKYFSEEIHEAFRQKYYYPLIKKNINGVVIDVYRSDLDFLIEEGRSGKSLRVKYEDLTVGGFDSFITNIDFHKYVSIGDTLIKEKGNKYILIHKKNGKIVNVYLR